ncbi:MAG: ester cyclase [Rhodoferax sp.]|nr:ester cyclase [Rhodoferax sp.]
MLDTDTMQLVARHLAAENAHQMEETLATLHPDCVFEDVALEQTFHGRAGARDHYATWWSAFDVQVQGERRYLGTDGTMIAEARYIGRHVGDFYGIAASGKPIDLRLAVIIGFREGLMNGERFYYDLGGLLRQIGAHTEQLRVGGPQRVAA